MRIGVSTALGPRLRPCAYDMAEVDGLVQGSRVSPVAVGGDEETENWLDSQEYDGYFLGGRG